MDLLIIALGAYLIGSIPFGLILTRLAGYGDIRSIGSGNIGATNVLRTGNKWLALATLALDFGKAFIFVWLVKSQIECLEAWCVYCDPPNKIVCDDKLVFIASLGVILGHMFPIWLRFKGGKGVACIFGLTYALNWQAGLCISAGWLLLFFTTRYSSLGALVGIPLGLITAALALVAPYALLPLALPVLLMIIKHHENIRRLARGEEHRFSFKKKESVIARKDSEQSEES